MIIWHKILLQVNRTVQTCILMDMEKIMIRCGADYLQYEFPKRKWYQLRPYNRIISMRLVFADEDILESDIGIEVYEGYDGEPVRIVDDSFWERLYEAMLLQEQTNYRDAEHLIIVDNGQDLSDHLYRLAQNRNYLSVLTDNPQKYDTPAQYLEEEYGLVSMFFDSKRELLRYIKQMPEKRKTFMVWGREDNGIGKRTMTGIRDKVWASVMCGLPRGSFVMDFSEHGVLNELIFKKRLKITYVSIPIFLDNIVKNRYNAVVNEGITFQVKKDKQTVWRRKGNEDGRKEKYPDL